MITLIIFLYHSSVLLLTKGTTCFRPWRDMPNSKTTSYILAAVKLIGILLKVSTGAGFCPVFPGMNRTHCGHMQSSLLSLCLSGPVIPCKCWICFKMLSTELGSATAAGVQHVLTQSPLKLVGSLGQVLSKKLTEEKHLLENLHDTRIFSLNQNYLFSSSIT